MSWKPSIPVFHLLLVFLLAGDLGSHIFVDANALECNYGWNYKGYRKGWTCEVRPPHGVGSVPWSCTWCGRNDGLKPSAKDCINSQGEQMNGGDLWACDLEFRWAPIPGTGGRDYHCRQSATPVSYYCKSLNKNQQCPEDLCTK
ncbi:uncharacterized protein MELLADRAFT_124239 [Melampsora larici-populina 98AG31]|uniref:Secreted protein n=1 Tax=Melampsora larici-populina (strain 98AG31 / pathotype 3-4-7) TaxID=747676 RepID=F4S4K1_MELLP|nr:uncharacterized protein MELLADRAFT_124239 [Melampsora larici-populina 98AG31]EGG00456.1 secreted protein [Melampsora larici-populina 98AG31]